MLKHQWRYLLKCIRPVPLCLLIIPANLQLRAHEEPQPNLPKTVTDIAFLGQAVLPTNFYVEGTLVGGLSGITYDPEQNQYYALSDDRGNRPGPIPEAGSLRNYIGYQDGSYFIEVPDGHINQFFVWNADYPDLVSAHRGGFIDRFPENAIETFENTLSFVPALLEIDVRRTADGHWILMHDDTLDRTTTGTGLVSETTLADIQKLRLVDSHGEVTDFCVPTLQEALIWAEGRTILELDLKSDDYFAEVVDIITDLEAEDQVRFITQDFEQAIGIYQLNPEIHLGLFITSQNQAEVFAGIESAPFGIEHVSAFTGTRPQPADFYQSLHEQGIVAIQGVFGAQNWFGNEQSLESLADFQRFELFNGVYERGGDVIASDAPFFIGGMLNYSRSPRSRYYTLTLDLQDLDFSDTDIAFTQVTPLATELGNAFIPGTLDPEGIAFRSINDDTNDTTSLFISSEGSAEPLIPPFINEFSLAGQQLNELPIAEKFLPTADATSGIRDNQAFESLAISPNGQTLYSATESALHQDGPPATLTTPSLARILTYDLATRTPTAEYLYLIDPIPVAPAAPDGYAGNGLVELVALDNGGTLLALERSFSSGVGNHLRLYEVDLRSATDIQNMQNLADNDTLRPVSKRLLLEFSTLNIRLDNSEALTLGPVLPDGRQTLIVVSDNNFNNRDQMTQFLAFSLTLD